MTFRDWAKDLFNMFNMDNGTAEEYWEAAFNEGVKWALQQDANTINKLGLTGIYAESECPECFRKEQE